jgi:MurNAc alpha-1-phosphate uridylyltransferase
MVPNPRHHERGDFRLAGGLLSTTKADGAVPGDDPTGRAPPSMTYAGIGIYTPRIFDGITRGEKTPLRPWLEREIAAGRAAGEYHGGLWFDIGTAQRLAELDQLLRTGSITVGV